MVKLFVGNVGANSDPKDLKAIFEEFGEVTECKIVREFAFVHMTNEKAAALAVKQLNGCTFAGRVVHVDYSHDRNDTQRRGKPTHLSPNASRRNPAFPPSNEWSEMNSMRPMPPMNLMRRDRERRGRSPSPQRFVRRRRSRSRSPEEYFRGDGAYGPGPYMAPMVYPVPYGMPGVPVQHMSERDIGRRGRRSRSRERDYLPAVAPVPSYYPPRALASLMKDDRFGRSFSPEARYDPRSGPGMPPAYYSDEGPRNYNRRTGRSRSPRNMFR